MNDLRWRWQLGITLVIPTQLAGPLVDPPVTSVAMQGSVPTLGQTSDSTAVAEFLERVKPYVALHQKLEASLPHLPKDATPEQIAERERALAALIQSNRADAKPGDLFTPATTAYVKRVLQRVFARPDGKRLRASIMDENPGPIALKVNGRYPDTVPIASMPPELLAALPKLPEELEYRFVGAHFILFDPHSHTIPDFIPNALPAA